MVPWSCDIPWSHQYPLILKVFRRNILNGKMLTYRKDWENSDWHIWLRPFINWHCMAALTCFDQTTRHGWSSIQQHCCLLGENWKSNISLISCKFFSFKKNLLQFFHIPVYLCFSSASLLYLYLTYWIAVSCVNNHIIHVRFGRWVRFISYFS